MALADIEIAGQVIRAGEGIIIVNETANRDPSIFPDLDLPDLQRNARDEDGIVVLLNANPSAERLADVERAAMLCPALAITVEE
ncbi:hypothetical protein AB0F17_25790 [Nonomuraea sp. NPDC026600]|uniref:ferredoxin n=1 Tax=Nonomuraea sp. NPDC026600 TaxID=3155363 RepID=UPI0034020952